MKSLVAVALEVAVANYSFLVAVAADVEKGIVAVAVVVAGHGPVGLVTVVEVDDDVVVAGCGEGWNVAVVAFAVVAFAAG